MDYGAVNDHCTLIYQKCSHRGPTDFALQEVELIRSVQVLLKRTADQVVAQIK